MSSQSNSEGRKRVTDNDSSDEGVTKKVRAPNWTAEEELALVNAMEPVYHQLFGTHSSTLSEKTKHGLWSRVINEVASCSNTSRGLTIQVAKKKWGDIKSRTKKKACQLWKQRMKMGGDEAECPTMDTVVEKLAGLLHMYELKIVRMIGVEGISGVAGENDTSSVTYANKCEVTLGNESETPSNWTFPTEFPSNKDSEEDTTGGNNVPNESAGVFRIKPTKKRPVSPTNIGIGQDMLKLHQSLQESVEKLNEHAASISHSLKELVVLKKMRMKIDPQMDLAASVFLMGESNDNAYKDF